MFKAARWRSEKSKSRAVFKLQFHASQVPPTWAETVTVSLVPPNAAGRPTARSERVAAVEGSCSWASPVYETVKLVRNSKTGKVDEKVYRFLISAAGSKKAEILGEASINLADYAEAFKASSVALPLEGSSTDAILHITIQRMQGDGEGREGDEDGETIVKRQRRTLESQLSELDSEDVSHINNETRVKFLSSRNMHIQNADSNGNLQKSHSFDAVSVSGSDASSGIYTPRENGMKINNTQRDPTCFLSPLINSDTQKMVMFNSDDLSATSAPDRSADVLTSSSGDAGSNETSHHSEDSIDKLKSDIDNLTRKLEVSELELHTLRKQIVKENKRGQDLSNELIELKEERDALKKVCEELKISEKRRILDGATADMEDIGEEHLSLLEKITQELDHEKNLNVHLRLQLTMAQEANSELTHAAKDLDGMLEQRNKELLCAKCSEVEMTARTRLEFVATKLGNELPHVQKSGCKLQLLETQSDNEEQYALDALVHERDGSKTACSMENKIFDLSNEIEFYRKDREDLEMQLEQLALDYEILKQGNHDISTKLEQMHMRDQLRIQYECSAHLAVISDLESHVEYLEQELQKQAEAFEADMEAITFVKVELEKRAILAEEKLRKTKWDHSNNIKRLQEEFRRFSAHMSSTFEENEKIVMQKLKENAELRTQRSNLAELLEKSNKDMVLLHDQHRVKFNQLIGLLDFKSKEADRLLLELNNKKIELENYKMSDEERKTNCLEELHFLKTELDKLISEKSLISEEKEEKEKLLVDMEVLKASIKERHKALEDKELEIELLKNQAAAQRVELSKLLDEINKLRRPKYEKGTIVPVPKSEERTLGVQCNYLKGLNEYELEKNLGKSTWHSKGSLFVENQMTTNWKENSDYNNTTITTTTDDDEQFYLNSECCRGYLEQSTEYKECVHDISGTDEELFKRYAGSDLDEDKQVFVSCTYEQNDISNILCEMEALKKQNKSMRSELIGMHERYYVISLKLAEVEGEKQQLMMTIQSLECPLKC